MLTEEELSRVAAFKEHAEEFCNLIEKPWLNLKGACESVLKELTLIYALALRLPNAQNLDYAESNSLTHDEWWAIFSKLGSELGLYSMYWKAENMFALPDAKPEAEMAFLDDDLADVYRAMKDGLSAWNSSGPTCCEDALFSWRFNASFEHWSEHAVGAIGALHTLCERLSES